MCYGSGTEGGRLGPRQPWVRRFDEDVTDLSRQADYEEYGYDAVGNRVSLRKRDGVTVSYQYDDANRLRVKTVPASASGAAAYSVWYRYDARGLQTEARFGSDSGAGVSNAYDALGRLVSSTTTMDGTARTLSSSYDGAGNRGGLSGNDGSYTGWTFDAAGRPLTVNEAASAVVQFDYDSAGRRSGLTGVGAIASATGYGYDALGRLNHLVHNLVGTSADQDETFAYNSASQLTTRTSGNDSYASNSAYNVGRGYSVNGLNQYTGAGPASFTYDANGNLTNDGSTAYVYDAENRLVSASGGHVATLSYDPMGRLWQVAAPTATTRFVYDGDRLVQEYDGAGTLLRSYRHGTGADEPLVWQEGAGGSAQRRFLHADPQGSIRQK